MDPLFYFALFVLFILIASTLAVVVWLAMLPGKVAKDRGHPQAQAIRVAGWLGLVTVVFWAVALVWAYTEPRASGDGRQIAELEERLAEVESRIAPQEEASS